MNEEDAATVCVLALDIIAFLDKADRDGLNPPHNYFCSNESCEKCGIERDCKEIIAYGMKVDRRDPDMNRQVRDRLEIIFNRAAGVLV